MRKRFLAALAAAAILALIPSAAWAHHPEIEASIDCDGVLKWTAEAWKGTGKHDHEASRTNDDIRITLLVEGEEPEQIGEGAFNKGNGFTFSGEHELGLDAGHVRVRAKAHAEWGNGTKPGDHRTTDKVKPPKDCVPPSSESTTTTTKPEDTTTTTKAEETTTTKPEEETTTTAAPTTAAPTTPPPSDNELPFTGAGMTPLLLSIGAGLVAAGGVAVFIASRRRTEPEA